MSSDSENIDNQILKLRNELKTYDEPSEENPGVEIIKLKKNVEKADGRKKPRSEKQLSNLQKMREARLLKGAEKKRAAELKKLKDEELKEEIEKKKLKNEYKKKYKKKYVSSSSSSSTEIIVKKKKKTKKIKQISASKSGEDSPIFKIEKPKEKPKEENNKLPAWLLE